MTILPYDVERFRSQMELEDKDYVDWHSKNTVAFGSLVDDGWDWGRNDWGTYSMKPESLALIRDRINSKIEDHYYFRELGVLPPGKFKRMLKRKINDAMAHYGPIYEELISGLDIASNGVEAVKERTVHSDYPQAQLQSAEQDYASDADSRQQETVSSRSVLDSILAYNKDFEEPDLAVIKFIEPCFSNLLSFNM